MHTCDCFQVALSLGFLVDRTPEGSYKKYILIQLSSAGGMVLMLIGECNVQFCNTQETQPTQPKIHPGFLSLSWTLTGWFLVGPAQMPGQPKIVVMSCILPWILCRYMMCCNVLVYVLYYAVTCCVYYPNFCLFAHSLDTIIMHQRTVFASSTNRQLIKWIRFRPWNIVSPWYCELTLSKNPCPTCNIGIPHRL